MKKKKQVALSSEEYVQKVSEWALDVADWMVNEATRYVKSHQDYGLAMSALRLFKEHLGNVHEFDEVWDEWKGKPFGFHFTVYPNEDKTKMIVTFIDDEEK